VATTRDVAAERKDIDQTVAGQTVCTLFQQTIERNPDVEALRWKDGEEWRALTWREYGDRVRDLANGFISLGLEPGQFVTIMGRNLPEYNITDLAILHAGGIPVSLYNTLAPEQISYIVNHCEARFSVVEDRNFHERFLKIKDEISNVEKVVMWHGADEFSGDDWVVSYDNLMEAGRAYAKEKPEELERRWKAIEPEDLVTLIYTSGTTGPPKGVMISHYNVCWTLESLLRAQPLDARPPILDALRVHDCHDFGMEKKRIPGRIAVGPEVDDVKKVMRANGALGVRGVIRAGVLDVTLAPNEHRVAPPLDSATSRRFQNIDQTAPRHHLRHFDAAQFQKGRRKVAQADQVIDNTPASCGVALNSALIV
jgi:acyl-CoA synthetase (AMP-forming)/AMP-acid ligase II